MAHSIDVKKPGSNGNSPRKPAQELTLAEQLSILLRGKRTIFLTFAIVTAGTTIYTFTTKPVYEASALVLIDMKGTKGSLPFSFDILGAGTLNKITNELETLKSRSLAMAVIKSLQEKKHLDPAGRLPIPIIQPPTDEEPAAGAATPGLITERLDKVVDFVPIRESDIIKINVRSTDPREAALIANTYADSYVARNMNTSRTRSRAVREFLQSQRETKKQSLDTTETALQTYMRTSGTVSLDDETKKIVEQLSQLEATRDGIEVEISSRDKTLASYKDELARQEPAVARSIGESNDSYVKLLQEQLAKLEVQRDVVVAQNPSLMGQKIYFDKLEEIDKQIASLKEKLQSRTSDFLRSIVPSIPGEGSAGFLAQTKQKIIEQQIELDGLQARKRALTDVITEYDKQFNLIPQKSIDLARLQRARLSSEKLYLLVEEKFNEAAITEKSEFGYVDIIDPALVPVKPVSPKVILNLILGILAGLGVGIGIVLFRNRLDILIRTPEDLKRNGHTVLSTVSRMQEIPAAKRQATLKGWAGYRFDEHLVTFYSPLSPLAESYRRLRTNVQFAQVDSPVRSIVVTSPNPSEGKSTTVANLAIAYSQTEKRVLLVDADMRRPVLHRLLKLRKNPGLTDYLNGQSTLDNVTQTHIQGNLDVIASGTPPTNPAEMLGSKRMTEFIKEVCKAYDIVLFDSAPLLAVTDAAVLSNGVDGTIVVVSSCVTSAPSIERAIEAIGSVGGKVLGLLLNNFDPKKAYGGYYAYHRQSHYGAAYKHYRYKSNGEPKQKELT
jgi:capsular exopolysaccharide synthesis family protein